MTRPYRRHTQPGATELSRDDQELWDDWMDVKHFEPGCTTQQAAARLGVADKTLYRLASRVKAVNPT